jgi:hypothetical protein
VTRPKRTLTTTQERGAQTLFEASGLCEHCAKALAAALAREPRETACVRACAKTRKALATMVTENGKVVCTVFDLLAVPRDADVHEAAAGVLH